MKAAFWHERWETGHLGFHQETVNESLRKFWPSLGVADEARVFVPLCGKSRDMAWMRDAGHRVIGVEWSPIAIEQFFLESDLSPTESMEGAFRRFSGAGYDLYCGDFFEFATERLRDVRAVFDRAALIALPPETRPRYAAKMIEILPGEARILLITVEYDASKMNGPPHSVPPAEVERLFGKAFELETLEQGAWGEPGPRFRERGLDRWREHVLLLTPRPRANGRATSEKAPEASIR